MAYLECAKGGGLGTKSPRSWRFFVTECLIFDVLEEKISKTAKNVIIKIMVGWKGGMRKAPLKYATEDEPQEPGPGVQR